MPEKQETCSGEPGGFLGLAIASIIAEKRLERIPTNQMVQTATINFKGAPGRKRGAAGKFLAGILILVVAVAGFFYWRHSHVPTEAQADTTVSTAAASATATAPKTSNSSNEKSGHPKAIKATLAGFVNYMVSLFSPPAKAATVQPAAPAVPAAPAPVAKPVLPAKRVPLQTVAAAPLPRSKPQVLTPEQQRLKVAQDGFDNVLTMAVQHPDAYGFQLDDDLGTATLGKEIPIYTIALQGRDKFAKQPVSSLLKPTDEWVYPIVLANHIRYMVAVRYDGHNYVPADGSRSLGTTYDKILAQWPAGKGFHPQLITVPGLPAYYFTIPELPEQNITDTDRMFDYKPAVSPASIVLANCQ